MNGVKYLGITFLPMDNEKVMQTIEKIKDEAKRIEEDCIYSSKGHFYAAQFWANLYYWIGIPAVILTSIFGDFVLAQFDKSNFVARILTFIMTSLSSVSAFLKLNKKESKHIISGNNYSTLKNNTRIFFEIKVSDEKDIKKLVQGLEELNKTRNELNEESPQIPKWAFRKARKGIGEGESDYKVDAKKKE